jgi:ribonuclease D
MWALDAEWRPFVGYGKQGKMALIQLGDDRTVYLFHVIHMKRFPEALSRILEDTHIFKVGINIR